MPSQPEMIADIRRHDRVGLIRLFDEVSAGRVPAFWAEGMAMEYLVLAAFESEGVEVRWPYRVPMPASERTMEQIDGVLYVDGLSILVETKDTDVPQNVDPVAKLKSQLDRRPPQTLGLVVSRSGFTVPAATLTQLVSGGRIILWTGDELRYALAHAKMVNGFRSKYRHLVEQTMPDLLIIPTGPLSLPEILTGGSTDVTDARG